MNRWWEGAVKDVTTQIKRTNGGVWPRAYRQWVRVAEDFGCQIEYADIPPPFDGALVDERRILIPARANRRYASRIIAHELTEALLRDHFDHIAALVERRVQPKRKKSHKRHGAET